MIVRPRHRATCRTRYLVFLGIGATLAVALHAGGAVLRRGALRAAVVAVVQVGPPRDRRARPARCVPAAGTASLDASWLFILIVAAGTVPGGVVAIQIGINFYYMPVALSAKAAGTVLLPRLSREALHNKLVEFRETYDLGISWSWFVAVPASLTLLVSSSRSRRRSRSVRCADTTASRCSSASIAGLGLALLFATMYEFAKQTCYARHDVHRAARRLRGDGRAAARRLADRVQSARRAALLFGLGLLVTVGELIACGHHRPRRRARARVRQGASLAAQRSSGTPASRSLTIGPGALLGRAVQHALRGHAHLGAIVGRRCRRRYRSRRATSSYSRC